MPEDAKHPAAAGQGEASGSAPIVTSSATDVPGTALATELVAEGEQAERLGELDRAVASFSAAAGCADAAIAAAALTRLADALRSRAAWDAAIAAARSAQARARSVGRDQLLAHAILAEGNALMCRGDFSEAKALFERVLEVTTDTLMHAHALQNIGSILAQQGQLGAAERAFMESYGHFQRVGYRRGEATALNNYGRAALDRGDVALASDVLEQALVLARDADHGELIALATLNLAEARARTGELQQARELASSSLGFFTASGNRWREIECLRLMGDVSERSSDFAEAAACYERGLSLAQEIQASVETRTLGECAERMRRRNDNYDGARPNDRPERPAPPSPGPRP